MPTYDEFITFAAENDCFNNYIISISNIWFAENSIKLNYNIICVNNQDLGWVVSVSSKK